MDDADIYYKSFRFIDDSVKIVITDSHYNIIKKPTKEQINNAIQDTRVNKKNTKDKFCCNCKKYKSSIKWRACHCNKKDCLGHICNECYELIEIEKRFNRADIISEKMANRKCCICGDHKTYIRFDGNANWYNCKCNKDDCTGFICLFCYRKKRYYDEESGYTRSMSQIRNEILDKNTPLAKSIIDQAIVAKYLGIEDLNIKMNDFNYYIDMEHEKLGKIDVKSQSLISHINSTDYWAFRADKLDADTYFCLGYDKNRLNIIKSWIIPNEDWIIEQDKIYIYLNPSRSTKYDYIPFELDDDDIKKLNNIHKYLDIEKLFKNIANIK